MSQPLSTPRQQQLLQEMVHLVARRAAAEQDVRRELAAATESAEALLRSSRQQLTEAYEQQKWRTQKEYQDAHDDELTRFQQQQQHSQQQYAAARQEIESNRTIGLAKSKEVHQDACWEAATLFDTSKNTPKQKLAQVKKQIKGRRQHVQSIDADAKALLQKRRLWRETPDPQTQDPQTQDPQTQDPAASVEAVSGDDPRELVKRAAERAQQIVRQLAEQRIAKLFIGARPFGLFVVLALALIYPAIWTFGIDNLPAWLGASCGAALLATIALCGWLYPRAKGQSAAAYRALRQVAVDAEAASERWLSAVTAQSDREYAEMVERCDSATQHADERLSAATVEIETQRDQLIEQADTKFPGQLQQITQQHELALAQIEEKHPRLIADIESRFSDAIDTLLKDHASQLATAQETFDREYAALKSAWHAGMDRFDRSIESIIRQSDALFPEWPAVASGDWTPAAVAPPAIRFGSYCVDLQRLKNGISTDYDLRRPHASYTLPALLTFPQQLSMLLKAKGPGRGKAVEMMQAVMLRLLVSIPPGKVRFTILDPMGLGENFAAFMHLADYDESLVTSRIWTEASHIEQRLADLTEHMENVIQKYLRNEFESIEQYNQHAGEVAEPYHILVAANFPNNFNESAVRRLASIATTGPRCGVYTLISVDTQQTMPHNFNLADLEPHAVNLQWNGGRFLWDNPALQKMPLTLDAPPPPAEFTEIVRNLGELAKDANRVEVPFEFVTPKDGHWWTRDSAASIDVALGRAGATKLQSLRLGKGTSQHVLMAGKTGSGKSTLLHAIVVNLALHYSPEQVEFYLVDFKKGVEFKTYATLELPHARVIAIESEREFGLSVLQKLDAELKRRGDLFRDLGVQDLAGFRKAKPDAVLPRTLLVIDEFQEMFVEDDKLAQDASLLLDRLVRQGRAFGMHVLLGSQTLGGAYSLPRSTIGQMAVRIALQCSEADAHLILSEDNTAARLLSRPGEAIYNDANGLLKGNHPFQVVWLGDDRREEYLRRIQDLAREKNMTTEPPIVFEGNIPADPSRNPLLQSLVEQSEWTAPPRAPRAWVGAAIAIKDPTAAVFRRQSGANLLIVGQRPEAAIGILSTCLVSLAAQFAPGDAVNTAPGDAVNTAPGARFYILDGTPSESDHAGAYLRLAKTLPHPLSLAGVRELPAMISEIAQEVTRREASGQTDHPPIFLLIHDLGRLRDLRKADDDFSFSRSDEDKPPSPGKQFAAIFRDGPVVGVHTLAWCDSYNNVNRFLDRQSLREFENRILFQMSSTDSSNLIDSPAAGKLGVHRALLYSEEHGQTEKFRPYGTPSDEHLAWVAGKLRARTAESPIV